MGKTYRNLASFGKRMEYNLVGKMLMEGLDCYIPLVDDHGVDCVIKKDDGTFIELQIKARSNTVKDGNAALFAGIKHNLTPNYYFVFYSERMDTMWIMSSKEFIKKSNINTKGKHAGKHTIKFNGYKREKNSNKIVEYCKPEFEKYIANDFSRLH